MITPTVGRVVWYFPEGKPEGKPYPVYTALVAHVWGDEMINIAYFDSNGIPGSATSVYLQQDGGEDHTAVPHCEWMPYQKGQAAKVEELEKKLA